MVEALKITDDMKQSKQNKIDELVARVNARIKDAIRREVDSACFPIDKDNSYYWEVRTIFEREGYRIKPTGYIGGVWQQTEDIVW